MVSADIVHREVKCRTESGMKKGSVQGWVIVLSIQDRSDTVKVKQPPTNQINAAAARQMEHLEHSHKASTDDKNENSLVWNTKGCNIADDLDSN